MMLFNFRMLLTHAASIMPENDAAVRHSWPGVAGLLIFISLFSVHCSTTNHGSYSEKEVTKYYSGHWVDDSTYRIAAAGAVY